MVGRVAMPHPGIEAASSVPHTSRRQDAKAFSEMDGLGVLVCSFRFSLAWPLAATKNYSRARSLRSLKTPRR